MEEVTHMSTPSLLQRCCRAMEGHVDSFVLEPTAGNYPEVVPWSIQFRWRVPKDQDVMNV